MDIANANSQNRVTILDPMSASVSQTETQLVVMTCKEDRGRQVQEV